MPHPITTDEMVDAIEGQDVQLNLEDLNELLEAIQEDIEDMWNEHMSSFENGDLKLVGADQDSIVFADESGIFWQAEFDAAVEFTNLLGIETTGTPETILAAHHNAAYRLVDYNWASANPVVVGKPDDFEKAQTFVESAINSLMKKGLSPGQAWAFFGVILRGNSRNKWAQRCGYSDHSPVSEAVRKAKSKL